MKNRIVSKLSLVVAAFVMVIGFTVSYLTPALADDASDARQLVVKSKQRHGCFPRPAEDSKRGFYLSADAGRGFYFRRIRGQRSARGSRFRDGPLERAGFLHHW